MTRQNKKTETKQVCNTSIAENIGLITETSWEVCNKNRRHIRRSFDKSTTT